MWTIGGVKRKARKMMSRGYLPMLLVSLILMFTTQDANSAQRFLNFDKRALFTVNGIAFNIIALVGIYFVVQIFIIGPIGVGCWKYYIDLNRDGISKLSNLKFAFENGRYKNIVKGLFRKDVYLLFWSTIFMASIDIPFYISEAEIISWDMAMLLAIIAGIFTGVILTIKTYAYMLVPMILVDRPNMENSEVVILSEQLMKGNKGNVCIFQLSFIGWILLGSIGSMMLIGNSNSIIINSIKGMLVSFFVLPYIHGAMSEIYEKIVEDREPYSRIELEKKEII